MSEPYRLSAAPSGYVLTALSFGDDISALLAKLWPAPFAVRNAGAATWLIVGDGALDFAAAAQALGAAGALIDQSHGRVRFVIDGPGARAKLARGIAVNLAPSAFPEGAACETMFNPIGVHLTRVGADRFELIVGRSFSQSLWEELSA